MSKRLWRAQLIKVFFLVKILPPSDNLVPRKSLIPRGLTKILLPAGVVIPRGVGSVVIAAGLGSVVRSIPRKTRWAFPSKGTSLV